MDELYNQQIKEAFYLVYGNKNFKYTPLRFSQTDESFINFLKDNTDISIKDMQQGNQKYYLITDIKFMPANKCSISNMTMSVLLYLNYETCSAFDGCHGFFSAQAIERYFEYFEETEFSEIKIGGVFDYSFGIFKCKEQFKVFCHNPELTKIINILDSTFKTRKIECSYKFDVNSIIRHEFDDLIAKSLSIKFIVDDNINSRTGTISRIYYNVFKNLVDDNFNNKLINDSCYPSLANNVTVENIANFIDDKLQSLGLNYVNIEVTMGDETAAV